MSDVFEGPGWWMASDGKWYAPHLHHDYSYRERFAQSAAPASPDPATKIVTPPEPHIPFGSARSKDDLEVVEPQPDRPTADVGPSLGSMPMPVVTPVPGSVAEMLSSEQVAGWNPTTAQADIDPERLSSFREKETFSRPIPVSEIFDAQVTVPSPTTADQIEEHQPVGEFESSPSSTVAEESESEVVHGKVHLEEAEPEKLVDVAPDHVDEAVWETLTVDTEDVTSRDESPLVSLDLMGAAAVDDEVPNAQATRAKLEIGQVQPPSNDPPMGRSDSTTRLSTSTDLVPVSIPARVLEDEPITWYGRGIALTLFFAGIAMIVGTFVAWIEEPGVSTSGWDLGDGVATIVAGVLGSAAAGPVFVGFRHLVPKTVAIIAGIVGIVVAGLTGLRTFTDSDAAATSIGIGFWIVMVGSVAMLAAGIADRSKIGD